MKQVGTIVSKPIIKPLDLSGASQQLKRMSQELRLKMILGVSALAGGILLKTYMALSSLWLAVDKMIGKQH